MAQYVQVCESDGDTPVELPLEDDGTLLLPTLTAQFPKCTGLKYKPDGGQCFRGVRLVDERLHPPVDEGWSQVFICVFPKDNKRRGDENGEDSSLKIKRFDGLKCTDLVVLNLPWRCDEDQLREYFSKYGELATVQIKREPITQKSRGYGFIRFREYAAQVMCLSEFHHIDGRRCDVRIPMSKVEGDRQEVSRKVHVGGITREMDASLLRRAFSKYGLVVDVFIPKPFRSFAFVTFDDTDAPAALMGQELDIEGHKVTIGSAVPKLPPHMRTNGTNNSANSPPADSRTQSLDVAFQQSLLMGQSNTPWGGWSSPYGVLGNGPANDSHRQTNHGSRQHNASHGSHASAGGTGFLGLNHVTAAAAANLAAQYTRAHQKQSASNPVGASLMGPTGRPINSLYDRANQSQPSGSQPANSLMASTGNTGTNAAAIATLNILQDPNVVAAIVSAATGSAGPAVPGPAQGLHAGQRQSSGFGSHSMV